MTERPRVPRRGRGRLPRRRSVHVPWWGVASAAAAPVLLIGGWTLAAARQQPTVGVTEGTISALAAYGADDRWVMTAALTGLGLCHTVTALALRPAARAGRVLLALGGAATVAVAALPLPAGGAPPARGALAHAVAAAVAFGALAVWPALAGREAPPDRVLTRRTGVTAAAVLTALVAWFVVLLVTGGRVGLAERVAAAAQAVWPLLVVLALRRSG